MIYLSSADVVSIFVVLLLKLVLLTLVYEVRHIAVFGQQGMVIFSRCNVFVYFCTLCSVSLAIMLQCFDAVGWAARRVSGL